MKWKQKQNITKSVVTLEVFGITKDELLSRNLIREVTSPPPRILEKVLEVFRYPNTSTHMAADPEGDLIVVQGQLHFYRLFRSTGKIERVSDNAVLELNWPAIPDGFRLRLKRECDSDEQLGLRATLLMYDSIYAGYFTVSSKK